MPLPEETPESCSMETLDHCAETVYEEITRAVCASPSAPPGFLPVPWAALPGTLKQHWRDAVAKGLAEFSRGQA